MGSLQPGLTWNSLSPRLAFNSKQFSCLSLPGTGFTQEPPHVSKTNGVLVFWYFDVYLLCVMVGGWVMCHGKCVAVQAHPRGAWGLSSESVARVLDQCATLQSSFWDTAYAWVWRQKPDSALGAVETEGSGGKSQPQLQGRVWVQPCLKGQTCEWTDRLIHHSDFSVSFVSLTHIQLLIINLWVLHCAHLTSYCFIAWLLSSFFYLFWFSRLGWMVTLNGVLLNWYTNVFIHLPYIFCDSFPESTIVHTEMCFQSCFSYDKWTKS